MFLFLGLWISLQFIFSVFLLTALCYRLINFSISHKFSLASMRSACFFRLYLSFNLLLLFVESLSCGQLSMTPWTAARQASLSFTISQSLLQLMYIESVMPSNHLILSRPLLLPSVFPSIRVFSNELALHVRWPKDWNFSFSLSPSHEYSAFWFSLGWTSWISLQLKGLSRVFSSTTIQKHQFFGTQPSSCL